MNFKGTTRLAYLYILPAALVMCAITFYPMLYGVWMAFIEKTGRATPQIGGPSAPGLSNPSTPAAPKT